MKRDAVLERKQFLTVSDFVVKARAKVSFEVFYLRADQVRQQLWENVWGSCAMILICKYTQKGSKLIS